MCRIYPGYCGVYLGFFCEVWIDPNFWTHSGLCWIYLGLTGILHLYSGNIWILINISGLTGIPWCFSSWNMYMMQKIQFPDCSNQFLCCIYIYLYLDNNSWKWKLIRLLMNIYYCRTSLICTPLSRQFRRVMSG